jgi:hypothetical protein
MRIELTPVVCWLTQETADSYEDSLRWVLVSFRDAAERYLSTYDPWNRSGYDHDSLVYVALHSLERTILDQYLPRLRRDEAKGVNCIWPWWKTTGIKVALESGLVDSLPPELAEDGELRTAVLADKCRYGFTVYLSETPGQRHRWLRHAMRQTVREERPSKVIEMEVAMDDSTPEPADRASSVDDIADKEFLQRVRAIVDSADYRAATNEDTDTAARQRRHRAIERLRTAGQIIVRAAWDQVARTYWDRLREAADGARRRILDTYSRRYLEHAAPLAQE